MGLQVDARLRWGRLRLQHGVSPSWGWGAVFWKGCKPNSVFLPCGRERAISLSGHTRDPSRRSETGAGRSRIPYLTLLPMGFSVPSRLRGTRWALTPPFHPCRPSLAGRARRFDFLWHCPSAGLAAPPPAHIPGENRGCVASRPMEFGLSSPGLRRERPSALPERPHDAGSGVDGRAGFSRAIRARLQPQPRRRPHRMPQCPSTVIPVTTSKPIDSSRARTLPAGSTSPGS